MLKTFETLRFFLFFIENKTLREQNHDDTKISQTQDPESEGNKVCTGGRYVSCQSKILVDGSISVRVDVKANPNSSEMSNDPRVPVERDKLKEPCVGQIEERQDVDKLGVQPTTTPQDSATSKRKATDLVGKGRHWIKGQEELLFHWLCWAGKYSITEVGVNIHFFVERWIIASAHFILAGQNVTVFSLLSKEGVGRSEVFFSFPFFRSFL